MDVRIFPLGEVDVWYMTAEDGVTAFLPMPRGVADEATAANLPGIAGTHPASMVQAAIAGEAGGREYSAGITLCHGETANSFRVVSQTVTGERVVTVLRSQTGLVATHTAVAAGKAVLVSVAYENDTESALSLNLASTFCLSGMTPFDEHNHADDILLHRARSGWSGEGRLHSVPASMLGIEDSWANFGLHGERIGQVGSMPARQYLPFYAVEDKRGGITWAVESESPASWQIEAHHLRGTLSLVGGCADYLYGHWRHTLAPHEKFATRTARICAVRGDIDAACAALTASRQAEYAPKPSEASMPVIYNEYCCTWGKPSMEALRPLIARAAERGAKYFVMDAGWYRDERGDWTSPGDWVVNPELFPRGVREFTDAVKSAGMRPGIWFEFECLTDTRRVYSELNDCLLRLDGQIVRKGDRCFLDFRREEVRAHLRRRVIDFLRDNGFGYMKADYNENIGLGCDGGASAGDGLQAHTDAVLSFFAEIRRALPDLVLEICASGGMRHEPTFVSLADMVSFSDAHEGIEGAVIAAGLRRFILPAKLQIWATIRPDYDLRQAYFTMAKAMTGRYCLSGDITALSAGVDAAVASSVPFYRRMADIVRDGHDLLIDDRAFTSLRFPRGKVRILRASPDESALVAYAFAIDETPRFAFPLPAAYTVVDTFGQFSATVRGKTLTIEGDGTLFGGIALLRRTTE